MVRSHTRKLRGGKFIGEGTYGCTFSPPLKCQGEASRRNGRYLSKLMLSTKNVQDETASSVLIQRADPSQKYFLTTSGTCKHNQKNMRPDNNTGKCKKFPLPAETYLVFYEMGGKDLLKAELPANSYAAFFKGFRNLFEGLVVLHSKNIVHLDIKSENIVGRLEPNGVFNLRFIDFGLTRDVSTLNGDSPHVKMLRDFNVQTPYPYYPFDLVMTSPRTQVRPDITQPLVAHWYKFMNERGYNIILPNNTFWLPNGGQAFDAKFFNREFIHYKDWYRSIVQHLKSVDVYSMGVTLAEVYTRFTGQYRIFNPKRNKVDIAVDVNGRFVFVDDLATAVKDPAVVQFHKNLSQFSKLIYNLINELVLPLGPQRPSTQEALDLYTMVLDSMGTVFSNSDLTLRALKVVGGHVAPSVAISADPVAPASRPVSRGSDPGLVRSEARPTIPRAVVPAKKLTLEETLAAARDALKPTHVPPPKPEGWEHLKNSTGKWYWEHVAKKHTQWNAPIKGYLTHQNDEGRRYYENMNTGTTQWNKPSPKARRTRKNRR